MKRVFYIGYYDKPTRNQTRECFMPATNLMDYLVDCIDLSKYSVEYVSMSGSKIKKFIFGKKEKLADNKYLKTFFSFGKKYSLFARLDVHFLRLQMFLYLFFKLRKNDVVIVYHSLNYTRILALLKKIKKFNLVSHFCEIYQNVSPNIPEKLKKHEFDLLELSDAFICSNKYLESICNKNNKPSALLYGIYRPFEGTKNRFDDEKIHVVYAGTMDPAKGGANYSVSAAEFLPEEYHVHILGKASDNELTLIKNRINEVNTKSRATVTYDGYLYGEEFDKFLCKCDIGLATQIPDAAYAETSFPSKVLTYLSGGVEVVSSSFKAILDSPVASAVYFYDNQTPQDIAQCILQVSLDKQKNNIIKDLDKSFRRNLSSLLESFE